MSKFQKTPVRCPSCKQPFVAQLYHIVDVATDPGLKYQLLSGRLNAAACPACGMAGMLGMPFAYHDPDKELLFVFMPPEAGLKADDQQKLIGALAQEVLNGLSPEKRKAYLLQPQMFIRLPTMIDAILLKDGVTPEMMERQKQRSVIINGMLAALEDDKKLAELAETHQADLDYEFYATLTGTAEAAAEGGDEEFARRLLTLRAKLLELKGTPVAAQASAPAEAADAADEEMTADELLERLLNAADEREFEALVVVGRPWLDYAFYLEIANRMDAAEKAGKPDEAKRLGDLRQRLLDLTAKLDAEAQQAVKEATELLRALATSDNPATLAEQRADELDDLFFYVLTSNINHAAQDETPAGQARLARLNRIADLTAGVVEKRMPPRLRLINQLLRARDDVARQEALTREDAHVTLELLQDVDALIGQFADESQDVVRRLEEVKAVIQARLTLLGRA